MFTPPNRHRLPSELEVMPFILRAMEFTGLWGSPVQIFRFLAAFGWGTMIILFPKAVLGIGSNRFDEIAKGIGELFFEGNLYGATAIFALKRTAFEQLIDGLREIFHRAMNGPHSDDCYDLLLRQNLSINKFLKGFVIYCCFGPSIFCVPSLAASHFRYWTHSGNQSEPLIFELPMEQEFYGLQVRTNFLHYHIFVLCSLFAYSVCGYFLLVKVSALLLMIQYSSSTYRLVELRIRKMAESKEVGAAIYDLPWFEHSVELQRYYRLMLQRVQRPTEITGAKFFVVQLATFGSAVQMSYSYYLVLKDLFTMI